MSDREIRDLCASIDAQIEAALREPIETFDAHEASEADTETLAS